jgi:hypothetical protein
VWRAEHDVGRRANMKIKRTVTETLDIPDGLSIEDAAQLLQNPAPEELDHDDDVAGDDEDREGVGDEDDEP